MSVSQMETEGTRELVAQYLTALSHLAERAAEEPDGGWALTRPLLFHAHHTAELAAKSVLLLGSIAFEPRHGLVDLWKAVTDAGLDTSVEAVDSDWCASFVALIADLTGNSVGARYARPNAGHTPIDDTWCCVNPTALAAATDRFAIQCIALAQAAEEVVARQI